MDNGETKEVQEEIDICSENAEQRNADIEEWMSKLRNGEVPNLMDGSESPVVLKKNEVLKIVFPAPSTIFMEPRSKKSGFSAGYKGLKVYQSTSYEKIAEVDRGMFVLTNKRLLFSGEKRTININLSKIISVDPYEHELVVFEGFSRESFMGQGITLRRERKSKPEYFVTMKGLALMIFIEDRVYNEPLTSEMFALLIKNLIADL